MHRLTSQNQNKGHRLHGTSALRLAHHRIWGMAVQLSIGRTTLWETIPSWIWTMIGFLALLGFAYMVYLSNDPNVFP